MLKSYFSTYRLRLRPICIEQEHTCYEVYTTDVFVLFSVLLNTQGVYTITVYPDSVDATLLDERLQFGVKWTPGCLTTKWSRGKKRIRNTGPTLTLTKVEGAAGVYTIYRNNARRRRGWAVHIQVIVSGKVCSYLTYLNSNKPRTLYINSICNL